MQAFTPFPLRARGSLELFDASIKLYKQYFWVLLGWSAIIVAASMFGMILPGGGMAALFITPVAIGSAACCVAAAVRGQTVEFGQCWRFTQPRYWPLLGMHLLASIAGSIVIALLVGACVAITITGVFAFRESSGVVQLTMGILAFLVLGTIAAIVTTVFVSWMGLVPIVVCMEEDKRNMSAMGRAFEILRGHWVRITVLMALVGLGMLALMSILGGAAALAVGIGRIGDLMRGSSSDAVIWLGIAAMGLAYVILWMLWTPLYYLILTVFYLDVRVRQEALDLEWTAHQTAPAAPVADAQPAFHTTLPVMDPAPAQFSSDAYGTQVLQEEPSQSAATAPAGLDQSAPQPGGESTSAAASEPRDETLHLSPEPPAPAADDAPPPPTERPAAQW